MSSFVTFEQFCHFRAVLSLSATFLPVSWVSRLRECATFSHFLHFSSRKRSNSAQSLPVSSLFLTKSVKTVINVTFCHFCSIPSLMSLSANFCYSGLQERHFLTLIPAQTDNFRHFLTLMCPIRPACSPFCHFLTLMLRPSRACSDTPKDIFVRVQHVDEQSSRGLGGERTESSRKCYIDGR